MGRAVLHLLFAGLAALLIYVSLPQAFRPQGFRLETYYGEIAGKREQAARDPRAIRIAVVWPRDGSRPESLIMGAQVAAEEANRKTFIDPDLYKEEDVKHLPMEGGRRYCEGVPLKIPNGDGRFVVRCTKIVLDRIDPCSEDEAEAAKELSADPKYVAVVGHSASDIAKHVSIRYQYTSLLYFAVNATDPALTTHGFGFVFRNVPTDNEVAEALAKTLVPSRRDKAGILFAQSGHSREVRPSHMLSAVNIFSSAGARRQPGLDISFHQPYGSVRPPHSGPCVPFVARVFNSADERLYERHLRRLRASIDEARQNDVQIMMLLDDQPLGARAALSQIRLHGPEQRVLGGPPLDTPDFFDAPAGDGRLVRLPAATAPVSYFSMPSGGQEKANYVRARARELSYLFVGDWGAPIRIDDQTARRVVELIGAQLDAARVNEGEDLRTALELVNGFAEKVTPIFEEGRAQEPHDPWFVPGALGIYLGVLETTLANAARARPGVAACLQTLPTPTPVPTPPPVATPPRMRQIVAGAAGGRATPMPTPQGQWSFAARPAIGPFRAPEVAPLSDWCEAEKVRVSQQSPGTYQKAAAFLRVARAGFLPPEKPAADAAATPADAARETPAAATVLALLTYKYGRQPYQQRIEERIRSVMTEQGRVTNQDPRVTQEQIGRALKDPNAREMALWSLLAPPAEANYEETSLDPEGFLWRLFATAIVGENPTDFGIQLRALSYVSPDPCTTSVASVFSSALKIDSVQSFVKAYRDRYRDDPRVGYRDDPDPIAAQGYEAIKVLAAAYARKGSVVPTEAASVLRRLEFDGVTGKITFDNTGDVKNKLVFLKVFGGQGPAEFGCKR